MAFLWSSRVAMQDVLDHAAGQLVLTEKNPASVFLFQQRGLFFAVRAHDDLDSGVHRARGFDHAPNIEHVWYGDYEQPRAMDMRLDQNGGIGGVAGNSRNVACAQLLDDLAIFLGNDERDALRN